MNTTSRPQMPAFSHLLWVVVLASALVISCGPVTPAGTSTPPPTTPPTDTPVPPTAAPPIETPVPPTAVPPTFTPTPTATPVPPRTTPRPTVTPLPPLSGSGGGMLAFVRSLEGSWGIYAMNADGSDERCLTRHGQPVAYPEWSPDGSQIAFHKHQSDAVWSPEGTRIAFASNRDTGAPFDTDIYIMNADGTDQQRIAAKAGDEWGIDWRKTD